ncbi:MAG: kynureninase [Flavisolibacter sp.]
MKFENSQAFARQMDIDDPLKIYREQFHIPLHEGKEVIYFTGNSLGLQPKTVKAYVNQELDDWARLGVEGHFHAKNPWFTYHELFTDKIARLVGALPHEVVVMNQLTVNLHLLMTSFYRPDAERFKIICEAKAFPSDQYAMESQVRLHGFDPATAIVEVLPRAGEQNIRTEDIIAAIERNGSSTALILFSGVNYYTGQVFDMQAIAAAAKKVGAYAGFDLAHAAGNILLNLHQWNVDFACWCSYKYLNSGPGGVSGIFIHEKNAMDRSLPRMAGWWGYEKDKRFLMQPGFIPIAGAEGWQLSNAPILSMAAHLAALDLFDEAGMEKLVAKSRKLSAFLFFILGSINAQQEKKMIEIITPSNEEERGCQVSMHMLSNGKNVFNELTRQGVIADWREPDVIRVAPVPFYNTFEEVWRFGNIIETILKRNNQ